MLSKTPPFAVDGSELGLAGKRDGGDDFPRGGVDHGRVAAAALKAQTVCVAGLKDDFVGIRSGGNRSHRGQRGAVEDDHGIGPAVEM